MGSVRTSALCLLAVALALCCQPVAAQDLPLPLHGVEGYSGVFATYTAYFANAGNIPGKFGQPSTESIYVNMGNGRNMQALTYTQTFGDRMELGFAVDNMNVGDLQEDINDATGLTMSDDSVTMQNINVRYLVLREGKKLSQPAVTFGVHYKHNNQTEDINDDLNGTLSAIGVTSNHGVDYTLYATKMITSMKYPVMVNLGLRSSTAAHLGLLGFTNDRDLTYECNVCVMPKKNLVLAAEYRQKPENYTPVPGLVAGEDDWWTLCASYIASNRLTFGAGYGHFGEVLNHTANSSWGIKMKYEF